MPKLTPAHDVTKVLLGFCNDHGDSLTNLKLQKILYYLQGWHLAYHGEPLFPENLEAWIRGPVCDPVYQTYKRFGPSPIATDLTAEGCDPDLLAHVADIWQAYGALTGYDLEKMSHQETPWKIARGDMPPTNPSRTVIKVEDMRDFFRAEAVKDGNAAA